MKDGNICCISHDTWPLVPEIHMTCCVPNGGKSGFLEGRFSNVWQTRGDSRAQTFIGVLAVRGRQMAN